MRTIDISLPVHPGMPGFPGDPPVETTPVREIVNGDPYNLSTWKFGSHTGTHVDPPLHFVAGGAGADRLDLNVLNGPCEVVEVDPDRRSIGVSEIARVPPGASRVLFRTSNSARWRRSTAFFEDYVALTDDAAVALLERRTRLVGIDALSVESDPSGAFPVHHRLLRAGVAVLEGLVLADVPAGQYELRCLPLRLVDADGAPCRAVLVGT
jgi:arylformamidase